MKLTYTPTVPATGAGASVDVREIGPEISVQYVATGSGAIQLQASGDNTNWAPVDGTYMAGSRTIELKCSAAYLRAVAVSGTPAGVLKVTGAPLDPAGDSADFYKGPDAAANEALTPAPMYRANGSRRVRDVAFSFWANVTGDPTNNATITLKVYSALGILRGTLATLTTTANATALVPVDATLGAQIDLVDGDQIVIEQTKGGTGRQLGGWTALVRFGQ